MHACAVKTFHVWLQFMTAYWNGFASSFLRTISISCHRKSGHSEESQGDCCTVWSALWAMRICWDLSEEFEDPVESWWPKILVHSRVQATVIIVLASCSGSKALTFKTKRFGRCVIYMTPFFLLAEGTENDSSLKPIASNQWGQCIKSETEHMKPPE